jgi:hypothetical protein
LGGPSCQRLVDRSHPTPTAQSQFSERTLRRPMSVAVATALVRKLSTAPRNHGGAEPRRAFVARRAHVRYA